MQFGFDLDTVRFLSYSQLCNPLDLEKVYLQVTCYSSPESEDELSDNSKDVDIVGRSRPGDRKTATNVAHASIV
jgi:hypothetical protein